MDLATYSKCDHGDNRIRSHVLFLHYSVYFVVARLSIPDAPVNRDCSPTHGVLSNGGQKHVERARKEGRSPG